MSISQSVAFHRDHLPTTTAISDAARTLGFDLVLDDADLAEHSGFLPAKLNGKASGFEWFLSPAAEYAELGIDFGTRDCVASFITHSDEIEGQSAMIGAAALMALTDGIYFDDYDNVDSTPDRIVEEARGWMDGNGE